MELAPKLAPDGDFIPLIVSQQRYFANRLRPLDMSWPCRLSVCWHYMDNPNHDPRSEDVDHGSMDMSYVGLFFRDFARLQVGAGRSHEPFAFTPSYLKSFANTFVENITGGVGSNFNKYVDRGAGEPPYSNYNSRCEGWLELTRGDAKVYDACHEMSLRIVDGQQPYLNMGNHSALLTNKQFLPPP